MIDNNTMIEVVMTAQQWNAVLTYLAEGPYKLVAPLVNDIQRQCQRYDTDSIRHRTNGEIIPPGQELA